MIVDASVGTLFDTLQEKLELEWHGGKRGGNRIIQSSESGNTETSLVGHLNLIHLHRVQIIGNTEIQYLDNLPPQNRTDFINQLFTGSTDLIIVGGSAQTPDDIKQRSAATNTPLFTSTQSSQQLVNYLQYYLSRLFAEKITLHGVFMEIFSLGLFITGESSVGKSELALELITRGHRLVADDAPVFARTAPDIINGTCPEILQDFLEVRGLGILNIRAMFGDSAIKQNRNLRLILKLQHMDDNQIRTIDRLQGCRGKRTILGISIPEFTLPVAPGRNLAVLAEAAARDHMLNLRGFDASQRFIENQSQQLDHE
jgi:HPr kinase/phosphorylase